MISCRSGVILALSASLAGCGSKNLCETSVKATLLNPETAQILDYREDSPKVYLDQVAAGAPADVTGDPGVVSALNGASGAIESFRKMYPELKIATFRLRAEGKLGNTVTSRKICFVARDQCICSDEDSISG